MNEQGLYKLRWIPIEKNKRGKQRYQLDTRHAMRVAMSSLPDDTDFTTRELACYLDVCIASARAMQQVPMGILLYPSAGMRMQERVERELCQEENEQEVPLHDLIEQTEKAHVYCRRTNRVESGKCAGVERT